MAQLQGILSSYLLYHEEGLDPVRDRVCFLDWETPPGILIRSCLIFVVLTGQ